jgi:O-antigen ligase
VTLADLTPPLDLSGQTFAWPQLGLYAIVGLFVWWALRRGWLTQRDIVDNLISLSAPLSIVAFVETIGELVGGVDISYGWRVSSLFGNPNLYAGWLLLVFPLMVARADEWRGVKRVGGELYAGLLSVQLLLTGSRAGIAGLAFAGFVCVMPSRRARRYVLLAALVVAVVFVVRGIDLSYLTRPILFSTALEQFGKCPIFGCGLDSFRWLEPGIERLHTQAHNLILHLLAETGIVGLGVTGVGLFLTAQAIWRKGQRSPSMLQAGMIFALLAQLGMSMGDLPVRMAGVGIPTVIIAVAAMTDNPVARAVAGHGGGVRD